MAKRARRLSLETIFQGTAFDDKTLRQPQWLRDGRLSYLDHWPGTETTTVWTLDPPTCDAAPVMSPEALRLPDDEKPLPVHAAHWSQDGTRLLLTQAAPARFQPCGDVYVYVVPTQTFLRVTRTDSAQYHPDFSPDGARIALVRDNDLWVIDVETQNEVRLTHDGGPVTYNGRMGWVYEEELGLGRAWAWSPDGSQIAFLQQDEGAVPEVLLSRYEEPHAEPRLTRYPKAGDPNPTVRLRVADVGGAEVRDLPLPGGEEAAHYVAALQWAPAGDAILLQTMPRLQNRLDLVRVDPRTGASSVVLTETDEAWVDHPGTLRFIGRDRFLWPSDRDGWRHLYLYSLDGGCGRLTQGEWEMSGVAGVDEAAGVVTFAAARPDPTRRGLYRARIGGGEPEPLLTEPGWHSALFSHDGAWFVHTHSTLNAPPRVTLRSADGAERHVLAEGQAPAWSAVASNGWELHTFTTSDGQTLHARIMKPARFDPTRRYPVLMTTYGGPGSQVVTDSWPGKGGLWSRLLAEHGCVLAAVDNRGTGARGRAFMKQTYLRLGHWEVNDQVEGARWLASLPFVDPDRIGIWGWSYGGYMAAMCITLGADVFCGAVAVAPVTDWRLYDSIYTERYMRTPAENEDGYRDGSPVNHANKLRGRLLIAHGTMDDNVHFQNAARLASALQDAGKPFEFMLYPGKHHGIQDRHLHLYALMTDFWKRRLRLPSR